jgi:hypothetical protein
MDVADYFRLRDAAVLAGGQEFHRFLVSQGRYRGLLCTAEWRSARLSRKNEHPHGARWYMVSHFGHQRP